MPDYSQLITCTCGEILVKSFNGVTKVRSKVVVFKNGNGYAVCKGCGSEKRIPIALAEDFLDKDGKNIKLFISDLKELQNYKTRVE